MSDCNLLAICSDDSHLQKIVNSQSIAARERAKTSTEQKCAHSNRWTLATDHHEVQILIYFQKIVGILPDCPTLDTNGHVLTVNRYLVHRANVQNDATLIQTVASIRM